MDEVIGRHNVTGVTAHPAREWTTQQARNLAADLGLRMESLCFLLRDRDGKYGQAFDAVFQADDLRVIKSAPQAPRMNAHCERVIGTIRRDGLDHILILGEAHARQVLKTYEDHYNRHRPHQTRNQLPPEAQHHPTAVDDLDNRRLLRHVIAVDGKTLRGARLDDGRQVHLLSALDTDTGIALAQVTVNAKTNEIPAFTTLLDAVHRVVGSLEAWCSSPTPCTPKPATPTRSPPAEPI